MLKWLDLLKLLFVSSLVLSCSDRLSTDTYSNSQLPEDIIDTLVVAHWNIGHFSLGTSSSTKIKKEDAQSMIKEYHSLLDTLGATMIGVCEYEPFFSLAGEDTRFALFDHFKYRSIGHKYSYNCNALFSTIPIESSHIRLFPESVQSRYYLESTIIINGVEVLFIETHLDWNEGSNGASLRASQLSVLVDKFSQYPHIIICGDFNVSNDSEFSSFLKAGFSMANMGTHGVFYTYPSEAPSQAIDNIIVKGFKIDRVDAINDMRLSDHLLLRASLVFL